MTRRFWVAALLGSSTAAACGFDLTAVDLHHHPVFSLDLTLRPSEAFHAIGRFHPGFDESGQLRAVSDDSLRMNRVAFAPARTTQNGIRRYQIIGTDPAASALHFELPAPAELGEPPPEVVVYRIAPASLDTLFARRDESLRIAIIGFDRFDPAGLTGSWALDVYPDGCAGLRLISLQGNTVPPPVLELPVALLPEDLKGGHVLLQGRLVQDASVSAGVYQIQIVSSFVSCIPFRLVP